MKRKTLCSFAALVALISPASVASQDSLSEDLKLLTDLMTKPLAQRAPRWECIPSIGYVCSTPKGCGRSEAVVSVRLNFAEKTYARCDSKGCDTYPMTFSVDGIFTTINLPGRGSTFLKVVNDGSQYLEVVSLHLVVQQNFGVCKPSR